MTSHRRIEKGCDPHNARCSLSTQWRRHLDQVKCADDSTQFVSNHTYESLVMLKGHLHNKYFRRPGIMAWRWEPSTLTRGTGSLARKQRGSKDLGAVVWEPFENACAALGPYYSGDLHAGAGTGHVTLLLNQKLFRSVQYYVLLGGAFRADQHVHHLFSLPLCSAFSIAPWNSCVQAFLPTRMLLLTFDCSLYGV